MRRREKRDSIGRGGTREGMKRSEGLGSRRIVKRMKRRDEGMGWREQGESVGEKEGKGNRKRNG